MWDQQKIDRMIGKILESKLSLVDYPKSIKVTMGGELFVSQIFPSHYGYLGPSLHLSTKSIELGTSKDEFLMDKFDRIVDNLSKQQPSPEQIEILFFNLKSAQET